MSKCLKGFHLTLLCLLLWTALPSVFADSSPLSGGYEQLRTLYDAGKTDDALQMLLKESGTKSASYYYDLGTLYFRMGRPGLSVAYLEKANRLKFKDGDITHNLALARTALSRLIGAERIDASSGPMDAASDFFFAVEVRAALGALAFLLLLAGLRSCFRAGSLGSWLSNPSGAAGLLGGVLLLLVFFGPSLPGSLPPAITVERQTVRSGPGERFLELSQVETGMKLRLLGPTAKDAGQEGATWLQVRYSGDGVGWIKESGLLAL